MLFNLLSKLQDQVTENLFTYSVVVVDNDVNQSGKDIITGCTSQMLGSLTLALQPLGQTMYPLTPSCPGDFDISIGGSQTGVRYTLVTPNLISIPKEIGSWT